MAWHARLGLDYARAGDRCVARFEHEGPLRILQTLYPEGDGIAHNVVVHPPSGIVGGDTLDIRVRARAGSHAVVTTPGASRFYRSEGAPAVQHVRIAMDDGARLEWLPLEAICYPGCHAHNRLDLQLASGAQLLAWDVVALGLPASRQPFDRGSLHQHIELQGHWLEKGHIDANDARWMDGPLGLAGHRCLATFFFASGSDIARPQREALLDAARAAIDTAGAVHAGATAPNPRVVAVRVVAPLVEPAIDVLKQVRAAWRPLAWGLAPVPPRTWSL